MEWICRTVSGTSTIRTSTVSATIDHDHGSPTFPWKKLRIDFIRSSSGVRTDAKITGSPLHHATTGCSAGDATPPAGRRGARRACGSRESRTPSSWGGTCTCSPAGAARPATGRAGAGGSPQLGSRRRLAQHLVDPLLEPFVPVCLTGLRETGAHDQHVVVARRDVFEPTPHDLAQLPLDAVADDRATYRLRHRKPE